MLYIKIIEAGRTFFLAKAAKAVVQSVLEVCLVYRISVCAKPVLSSVCDDEVGILFCAKPVVLVMMSQ